MSPLKVFKDHDQISQDMTCRKQHHTHAHMVAWVYQAKEAWLHFFFFAEVSVLIRQDGGTTTT